jgi:hypothetical protein
MWHLYTSGHINSVTVMTALAEGTGLPLHTTPCALQPGGMATYGNMRGLKPLLDQARAEGRDWLYLDNGYFHPSNHGKRQYDGYYRVTKNALQHDGSGNAGPERWQRLGKRIGKWKRGGRSIVVCPPGEQFASLNGFNAAQWLTDTMAALKQHSDRPVVIRRKPKGEPGVSLWDSLRDCHAMVAHSSNSAVEALLFGVPVFCTAPCAALRMGEGDLSKIESPRYPEDREQFFWNLAANQWTLAEMRSGQCWRELNGVGNDSARVD